MDEPIKEYRRALDKVLLVGAQNSRWEALKALSEFMTANGLNPPKDEVLEITMHKTITAAKSLPLAYRRRSKAWLSERGYQAWDDGEL
jgi:hypothetical protein